MPTYYLEEVNRKQERKRMSTICLALVCFLLFTILADFVLTYLVALVDYRLYTDREFLNWIAAASQYLVGFPICLLIMIRVPVDRMEQSDMGLPQFMVFLSISVFFLFMGNMLGVQVNDWLASLLGFQPRDILNETLENSSLAYNLITSVVAAPICEEMIFRKCLLDRVNRLGDKAGVILSGLLFGIFHGNFYQFFYALFVGFIFGYIYLRTGKIRYTIALHMFVNLFFGVISQGLYNWSEVHVMGEMALYIYGGAVFAISLLGFVLFLMYNRRAIYLKSWLDIPDGKWFRIVFPNVGMILLFVVCAVEFILNF